MNELLDLLQQAFEQLDPVPASVYTEAMGAFAWRNPDAAFAELVADAQPAGAGLRGESRLLSFSGTGVGVELEVSGHGPHRELVGRLAPAAPAELSVRHRGGELVAEVDPAGHFLVPEVPAGLVMLVFRLADASSIVTSWVRL
ncbi:MAG: hypothetical protein ABIS86_12370 [Streptosporangiaceae bacterium]